MDAADLFRQAQSSVNRAREAKSFRGARESSHESDDHSPRIAHTLTACCRCRQVRSTGTYHYVFHALTIIRERQDVILTFHDVYLARGLALYANILIRRRERKSLGLMLYGSKTKYGH
jgi:hypothetical protein